MLTHHTQMSICIHICIKIHREFVSDFILAFHNNLHDHIEVTDLCGTLTNSSLNLIYLFPM